MADQLDSLIAPLIRQCGASDVVTVVDDASTDRTGDRARELGARVLRVEDSSGPYHARQLAAGASQAEVLLFVDGRCRPLAGLLESHRELQSGPGILLSATDTRTRSGSALAARASARLQVFALKNFIGRPGRLDYYPTANLGVRKSAFDRVNGFRAMRSGADADLCWRIQQTAAGCMAVDTRTLMEWEPRTSMPDLLSQAYRYGKSYAYLQWAFGDELENTNAAAGAKFRSLARRVRDRLGQVIKTAPAESAACAAYSVALQVGYRVAKRRQPTFEMPRHYDSLPVADI